MHAYCLFCETQRCGMIAELIRRQTGCRCFSPQIIQRKWIRGVPEDEAHDWLPGYVFLYTEKPVPPKLDISGIIRWLGGGELTGHDLEFARMLYARDGVMGHVNLVQAGDRCTVADPSWEGLQGTVVKMDRGRKRCCLEFVFDDMKRTIWVGYELINPKK